ncbi:MAG: serine hydrolase [Ruminococcaceae bacterium]|nr:serine hydrolase [Oscillospiraceae bacterium]
MSKLLNDFAEFVKENNVHIYTIAEAEGNNPPETVEINPGNPCQNSYSVSKFFTLTALGFLWDEGKVSLDEKITEILAPYCPPDMDTKWHQATVEMAIRHYCGLPEGYLDIDSLDSRTFGTDYLGYVLSCPVGDTTKYAYTDAEFYMLARVVSEKAGKNIYEYLWEKLFTPLGFSEVAWSCCPKHYPMGATGLYIKTEDMVKLGALYLNNGVYNGKKLLSEEWINLVREKKYLFDTPGEGYGHGGMRGQNLMVLPKYGRALAWHGFHEEGETLLKWLTEYLGAL